jgi:hypothetical protein
MKKSFVNGTTTTTTGAHNPLAVSARVWTTDNRIAVLEKKK